MIKLIRFIVQSDILRISIAITDIEVTAGIQSENHWQTRLAVHDGGLSRITDDASNLVSSRDQIEFDGLDPPFPAPIDAIRITGGRGP